MKSFVLILTSMAFASVLGLTACGDETCEMCPTNPETHESVCSIWNGTYHGHMTTNNGDCGSGQNDLLDGDILLEVSEIGPDPDDEEQTYILIKLTDTNGNWTIFPGHICNTQDETSPKAYSFNVAYSFTDPNMVYKVENTLSGRFIEQDEDNPARIDANYYVSYSDMKNTDNNCQMSASVKAEN